MALLRDLPIKNKLQLVNLFSSALVLLLVAIAFIAYDLITTRQKIEQDLLILARVVGLNSAAGLIFDDSQSVAENIVTLKANPNIIGGHVFNPSGESIAKYHRDQEKKSEHINHSDSVLTIKALFKYETEQDQSFDPLQEAVFFHKNYVDIFQPIISNKDYIGTVFIRSDLTELYHRLQWALIIIISVLVVALLVSNVLTAFFQRAIIMPLYSLLQTMNKVSQNKEYALRETKHSEDEIGKLIDGFNQMLAAIEQREQALALANKEITQLNKRLKAENLRLGAELEVTRRLQMMILPRQQELENIRDLDIAGIMEPADEVGGDYYDVLQHNEHIKIGIGDVTGHGLESGVLMLMVQMAVRTLLINGVKEAQQFFTVLNRSVFENVKRMGSDKNLTLSLLDYQNGWVRFSGQHEEILVVRKGGAIERIDTVDLGFMIGIEPDISHLINQQELFLAPGDGIVLYTDGITEARNVDKKMYGLNRLCQVISEHWQLNSIDIRQAVIDNLHAYIGEQKIMDDITLLVLKRK